MKSFYFGAGVTASSISPIVGWLTLGHVVDWDYVLAGVMVGLVFMLVGSWPKGGRR